MANSTSCGDQTYFGIATPTVGWSTNIPNTITYDNTSGSVTVSGTSINFSNLGIGVTTVSSGSVLTVNGSGTSVWSTSINNDVTDFCEMVLSALGHDITYDDFCKMSSSERKALLRDIKIKRLLD